MSWNVRLYFHSYSMYILLTLYLTPPFSTDNIFVHMDSMPHNHRMARMDGYQVPICRSTACSQKLLGGLHTLVRHHPAKCWLGKVCRSPAACCSSSSQFFYRSIDECVDIDLVFQAGRHIDREGWRSCAGGDSMARYMNAFCFYY